jgi:anaerobic ribonucleoside-triphosphate reductase activating protein
MDTWAVDEGRGVDVDELVTVVTAGIDGDVDGVTISGGEPSEQSAAVIRLIGGLRSWSRSRACKTSEFDVLLYSGLGYERLQSNHPDLLAAVDCVVADPFVDGSPVDDGLRGSGNQRVMPMTPLGVERYGAVHASASMQVTVDADGRVWMIGIPRRGDLARVQQQLARRGVQLESVSWQA